MNGTDARGGNRTTSDLEAPKAARGIGAGTKTIGFRTPYLDPHTRWERVLGVLDNAALNNRPPRYVRHPPQPNVWLPTEEHPDADLTPAELYDKYATDLTIPDGFIPLGGSLADTRRILLEAGAYPGMLITSAMREAVVAVMHIERHGDDGTCCCGDAVDHSAMAAGHTPVNAYHYHRDAAVDVLRNLIAATKVPVTAERLSQVLGIPVEAPTKPLPAMARVVTDPKTGKMKTVEAPPAIDIERVRRETRDHITGNGAPWFTDPNAEAKPIGTTTWCELCNRNVTGEPCVTVYAGGVKGCFVAGDA